MGRTMERRDERRFDCLAGELSNNLIVQVATDCEHVDDSANIDFGKNCCPRRSCSVLLYPSSYGRRCFRG